MTATSSDPLEGEAARRHQRLALSVRDLRTRAGGADMARVLLTVGGILLPLGLALILLGWSGVSHATDVFEQMPYLVSGGLLGLALVFAGGFCYFAYWQTQVVRAVRRDAADIRSMRDSLKNIESLLAANAARPEAERANGTPPARVRSSRA